MTTKEKVYGTLQIPIDDFSELLRAKIGKHIHNIKHKENLTEDEVLLHVDFAENYLCGKGDGHTEWGQIVGGAVKGQVISDTLQSHR